MNRLLEVLRKLRGSIFKDFIGFVSWKNGKRQPEVLTLLVYLEKHHPRFKEKAVDSEVICKKLKIKNLSAASHRAIDILGRYLVYKHLENEDNQFDLLLAEVYHGMQIHSIANLAMGRVERKLKEEKPIGKLDGFYRFLVGDFLTTSQQGGPKHEINPHMQYAVDALDHFYWEKKLRYSCELANRKRVINADYHNHMIKPVSYTHLRAHETS